jgi:hypothetical protein
MRHLTNRKTAGLTALRACLVNEAHHRLLAGSPRETKKIRTGKEELFVVRPGAFRITGLSDLLKVVRKHS